MTDMTVANPRGMAYAGSLVRRKGAHGMSAPKKPSKELDAIADKVLAYRPTGLSG